MRTGGFVIRQAVVAALVGAAIVCFIPAKSFGQGDLGTTGVHTNVTCGATSTPAVTLRLGRKILILQNAHATDAVVVGQGQPATLTAANGVRIAAGASMVLDGYVGPMNCIRGAAADIDLRVMEITK